MVEADGASSSTGYKTGPCVAAVVGGVCVSTDIGCLHGFRLTCGLLTVTEPSASTLAFTVSFEVPFLRLIVASLMSVDRSYVLRRRGNVTREGANNI